MQPDHVIEQARYFMIEQQVRPWNVVDARVLQAMADVKREDFVPPAYTSMAFMDLALPLAEGQFMLSPRVQARLVQDAAVQATDKVLEIGTGTGFVTALLAQQAHRVISLELQAPLVAQARANLLKAGVHNADVRQGNGALGLPQEAPFDVIVLGGSVAQVPADLLKQLAIGGRLVAVQGQEPIMHGVVITRLSDVNYKTEEKWDDNTPRLQHFPESPAFQF
jgi:protein-L-isoaspartate(D-aspartate) O-methyltransferase